MNNHCTSVNNVFHGREGALAKIRARVAGTEIAAHQLAR
jgi:hypothetical protein